MASLPDTISSPHGRAGRASNDPVVPSPDAWLPAGTNVPALALVAIGYLLLFLPTFWDLSHTIWAGDEQGHGPLILCVCAWLLFRKRHEIAALPTQPATWLGSLVLGFGLLLYALGRSQAIIIFETGAQIFYVLGTLFLFKGTQAARVAWFPIFFLIFMLPLPGALVAALTTPLKIAVSTVAGEILFYFGYPIARSGVMLNIGQYQLMVADACAGLNSMFSLEAMGLLYLNIMGYTSAARNAFMAVMVIPISFAANIVRVIILVLVTFYFGDAAGQGFVHDFAGMVLFTTALLFTIFVDTIYGWVSARIKRNQS
jgi:exosortase B